MATIGKVSVKVWPDTSGFRQKLKQELEAATNGLDFDVPVEAKLEEHLSEEVSAAKKKAEAKAKADPIEIPAEVKVDDKNPTVTPRLDDKDLDRDMRDAIADAQKQIKDLDVGKHLGNDLRDGLRGARADIRDALGSMFLPGAFDFNGQSAVQSQAAAVKKAVAATPKDSLWSRLLKRIGFSPDDFRLAMGQGLGGAKASIGASWLGRSGKHLGAGFASARSQLSGLTGGVTGLSNSLNRVARMTLPKVELGFRKMGATGADAFSRLSGLRLAQSMSRSVWEPISNFDILMPKIGLITAGLNQLAASVGSLTSNLLTLGRDLGRVLPAALVLPGFAASAAAAFLSLTWGLKDLGTELPAVAEAFKAIPAASSAAFWETARGAEGSLLGLSKALEAGFVDMGGNSGSWFAGLTDSLNRIVGPAMPAMFAALGDAFDNLSAGSDGLATSLKELGLVGARFLPRASTALAGLFNSFGGWLEGSAASGALDGWINTGIDRIKDLGSLAASTYRVMDRLSAITERAGGASIRDFAGGVQGLADSLLQPRVANTIENLVRAAHETTGAFAKSLGPGLGKFLEMAGSIASVFGPNVASATGGVIGAFFDGLSSPAVARSMTTMSVKMRELGEMIAPVVRQSGQVVGLFDAMNAAIIPLGRVAGAAVGGVLGAVDRLGPSLARTIESLGGGLGSLAEQVFQPLTSIAEGIAGPLEVIGASIGSLLSDLAPAFGEVAQGLGPLVSGLGDGLAGVIASLAPKLVALLEPLGPPLRDLLIEAGDAFRELGATATAVLDSLDFGTAGDNAAQWASDMGTAIEEVKAALEWLNTEGGTKEYEDAKSVDWRRAIPIVGTWWSSFDPLDQDAIIAAKQAAAAQDEAKASAQALEGQNLRLANATSAIGSAYEDAQKKLQAFTVASMTDDLSGFTDTMRSAAPAIQQYWEESFGGAKAKENSGILMDALRQADAAMKTSGISAEDWGDLNSEAWQKAVSAGTTQSAALEGSYQAVMSAMQKTGLTSDELRDVIANSDMPASTKAMLSQVADEYDLFTETIEGVKEAELDIKLKAILDDQEADAAVRAKMKLFNPEVDPQTIDTIYAIRPLIEESSPEEIEGLIGRAMELAPELTRQEIEVLLGLEPTAETVTPPVTEIIQEAVKAATLHPTTVKIPFKVDPDPEPPKPVDLPGLPVAPAPPVKVPFKINPEPEPPNPFPLPKMPVEEPEPVTIKIPIKPEAGPVEPAFNETLDALTAGWQRDAGTTAPNISVPYKVTPERPGLPNTGVSETPTKAPSVDTSASVASLSRLNAAVSATRANVSAGVGLPVLQGQLASVGGVAAMAVAGLNLVPSAFMRVGMSAVAGAAVAAVGLSVLRSSVMSSAAAMVAGSAVMSAAVLRSAAVSGAGFARMGAQARAMAVSVHAGSAAAAAAAAGAASRIRGAFGGVSLAGAGARIMNSLLAGIRSRIGALQALLSSVTAMIPKFKGPEKVDAKLLTPAGISIMQSLNKGLQSGFDRYVAPSLQGFTADLSGAGAAMAPSMNVRRAGEGLAESRAVDDRPNVQVNVHNPKAESSGKQTRDALAMANVVM